MALDVHVLPLAGALPEVRWHRDVETDILSGSFRPATGQAGYNGTVELNDEDGSIAVVDVAGGVLCGLDLVVWSELAVIPDLAGPFGARPGVVVVPTRTARRGTVALEVDTTLSVACDAEERLFHVRIGTRRSVEPVRVAKRLVVEIDAARRLAGFWLEDVPVETEPA